ncbi:unnamed protein product [Ranitomeya imitator]|uniref:Uncharacterized protein n=1 Tax=Ranitomeya imitator TaxID=111125 RepID=A0ABN9LXZ9_9NEOB|nr:unnamed protein product [Ranitomeya imitator]
MPQDKEIMMLSSRFAFQLWKPLGQVIMENAKKISTPSLSYYYKGGFEQKMSRREASPYFGCQQNLIYWHERSCRKAGLGTPTATDKKEVKKSGKYRKCPICTIRLKDSWQKPLGEACTSRIVGEEQASLMKNMRAIIREEVQAFVSDLVPQPTQSDQSRKRMRDSVSSSEGGLVRV